MSVKHCNRPVWAESFGPLSLVLREAISAHVHCCQDANGKFRHTVRSDPQREVIVFSQLACTRSAPGSCNQFFFHRTESSLGADEAHQCQHEKGHQGDRGISARTVVKLSSFLATSSTITITATSQRHDHRHKFTALCSYTKREVRTIVVPKLAHIEKLVTTWLRGVAGDGVLWAAAALRCVFSAPLPLAAQMRRFGVSF